ncbi:MAG TPA: alkaline phosphatase family protein [Gaiellaceae bacterium]|nr:alkaline phosphatase family protein [Gaiellaceae bacterium]
MERLSYVAVRARPTAWHREALSAILAVLVVDCVTANVFDRLLGEGRLPALAELHERGRRHPLALSATSVDTGHFSLYSGLPLQEHGLHYLFQWDASEQRIRYVHDLTVPDGFWEQFGSSALVIDPYEGCAPRARDLVFARGFGFRERLVLPPFAQPADEWRRQARLHGTPPRIDDLYGRPSLARLERLRGSLEAAPARAAAAAVDLLARRSFDLVFVGFGSVHLGGHHFLDLSQLPEGDRPRARAAGLETALESIYVAVDAAVGAIVAALPEDADLLVVSPTGMGANTSRGDLLPAMVQRILGADGGAAPGDAIWRLRGAVPTRWRGVAARALPDGAVRRLTSDIYLRGVDWSRTRAFALPGDYRGFVRVNLRGRERDGIVDAADLDALLAEIAEGLATFCDSDGSPAVARVDRIESLVPEGRERHRLPDLVVRWSDRPPAASRAGVSSSHFGDVRRVGVGSGRPGNHTEGGWILAVPGAANAREPVRNAELVDVAATAAALLGGRGPTRGEALLEPV